MSLLETDPFDTAGHLLRVGGLLLGLGLFMAFSPTTFGIEIGTVEQSHQPRRRVLVIAGAAAVASTLLAVLFVLVSPNTLHALWTGDVVTLISQRWLDAAVGLVLIAAGVVEWVRAARPRKKKRTAHLDRLRVLFVVVLVNSLVSTSGPATIYLVVRTLGTTGPGLWPIGYLVFLIGLAAPYVALAVALTRIPAFARRVAQLVTALEHRDLRRPIAVAIAAAGLVLLIWAVVELVRAA